jgi:HSP20 family protein
MPVDIEEKEDAFVIKASVPGFASDEIDISIENDTLTIRGERQEETKESREGYYLSERYQGAVERSFCLGERVSREEINAELENGVLTLTLAKVEQAEPVKVAVKSA